MDGESESINSLKFVIDKVSFVNKLPMLSKASSDDETPTPGYMYQEITKLTFDRGSYCSDLMEYLVSRLEKRSYHVKLKVLRIMRYTVDHGHVDFRHGLRRKSQTLREATKFGGPPDPLHGNAPYVMVRKEAQELCSILFDVNSEALDATPGVEHTSQSSKLGGMGSTGGIGIMQGFGNTTMQEKSLTESLVGGLRELANKVLDPAPPPGGADHLTLANQADRKFSQYQPVHFTDVTQTAQQVVTPARSQPEKPITKVTGHQRVKAHTPGVAGGGWEDSDDDTDSLSTGGQREPPIALPSSELLTRVCPNLVEDDELERCLVAETVNREGLLLRRIYIEEFIKRCSSVNCVKVVENIAATMMKSTELQMHGLQLCESLLRTDLITADELATTCQRGLDASYRNKHQQTKVKARKVIRILEKLCSNVSSICDIISNADNDITSTQSVQHAPDTIECHRVTPTAGESNSKPTLTGHMHTMDSDDDMYVSSFDFIRPAFASATTNCDENSQDTGLLHSLEQSDDSLCDTDLTTER